MHRPGVKCVWSQACPCRAARRDFTGGFPSEIFRNKGPTRTPPPGGRSRVPTYPRLTTNASQTTEVNESSLVIFWVIHQVIFHPENLAFSPYILTNGAGWTALQARAGAFHAALALTETTTCNNATPEAIGSSKINSSYTQPTEGTSATPILPSDPEDDVMLAASSG